MFTTLRMTNQFPTKYQMNVLDSVLGQKVLTEYEAKLLSKKKKETREPLY